MIKIKSSLFSGLSLKPVNRLTDKGVLGQIPDLGRQLVE